MTDMEENRKHNEQQLSTDEQQLLTDESEGLTDEQQLLTDEQQLLTDEQQLLTDESEGLTDEQQPLTDEQQLLTDESEGLTDEQQPSTDEQQSLTDKQHEQRPKVIVNHNTNCQVFNGPISGCIFAMSGSHVEQHPLQYVTPEGEAAPTAANSSNPTAANSSNPTAANSSTPTASASSTSPAAGVPHEDSSVAPARCIRSASNPFVRDTLQRAGQSCSVPWHYACLMAVCGDHGLLMDRYNITGFVRALAAWGIVHCTTEGEVHRWSNSIRHTMQKLPLKYRSWGTPLAKERTKCEDLATYFDASMPYRYS